LRRKLRPSPLKRDALYHVDFPHQPAEDLTAMADELTTKLTIDTLLERINLVLTENRAFHAAVEKRFNEVDQRFELIETRLDRIESLASQTRAEMLAMRADFREMRSEFNEFRSQSKEPA
jgi:hypothetical protein